MPFKTIIKMGKIFGTLTAIITFFNIALPSLSNLISSNNNPQTPQESQSEGTIDNNKGRIIDNSPNDQSKGKTNIDKSKNDYSSGKTIINNNSINGSFNEQVVKNESINNSFNRNSLNIQLEQYKGKRLKDGGIDGK